jgi:hypothetical protein
MQTKTQSNYFMGTTEFCCAENLVEEFPQNLPLLGHVDLSTDSCVQGRKNLEFNVVILANVKTSFSSAAHTK